MRNPHSYAPSFDCHHAPATLRGAGAGVRMHGCPAADNRRGAVP